MSNYHFVVERSGIHTTFQDSGYEHLQHIGITTGGVVDNNLFKIANKLLDNDFNETIIEFAYQGPRLRLDKGKAHIVVTGDVHFMISKKSEDFSEKLGETFKTYQLNEGDIIDILATKSSVYGYFAVEGGFSINKYNNSGSTLVRSAIGPNDGKCIQENQLVKFNLKSIKKNLKQLSYFSDHKDNIIKVLEGPQINFFSSETIKNFFKRTFRISNNADRMGIRLEGNEILSKNSSNIPSEGIIKGSIQVPGDGNPIVLMTDHPTIGGYPKIATVILNDISKIAHLSVGKKIRFQKVSFETAEKLCDKNEKYLDKIFQSITTI
ncbi:MAG: biotin-dependent carboxyltransferase family protein [Pelagibacteraceae bacterium]|jgi:biotin-dependent carboxylase-like uncharacterized protein|nr:biotin-dependent carboxyltransferase family protein [Pelagibacteraceae bacterium]MDP6784901.1 biotin-dependent carboxyltransferase family protein [Alphaproteobacteria bacterium]MBO6468495.1 biotin-dependent carboxyltransferase family protein [Pelagibacteraceae bacterium]MBO6469301.1 biotin-dependent carboxyltransferase family protein [Pelagibacteraceae bacterium]MBO6470617.1 biotin-dependent carboxyltransferase family protein [Pelagibacteraceae bacterium]|tara:strand:+ start:1577 stop:2542 length:966 start_codon:yes stop_codon:yes gene_type:complete